MTLHNLSDHPVPRALGEDLPDGSLDDVLDLTEPGRRVDLREPFALRPLQACWLRLSEPARISRSTPGHPAAGA